MGWWCTFRSWICWNKKQTVLEQLTHSVSLSASYLIVRQLVYILLLRPYKTSLYVITGRFLTSKCKMFLYQDWRKMWRFKLKFLPIKCFICIKTAVLYFKSKGGAINRFSCLTLCLLQDVLLVITVVSCLLIKGNNWLAKQLAKSNTDTGRPVLKDEIGDDANNPTVDVFNYFFMNIIADFS